VSMPDEPSAPRRRENVLTRRLGPLPTWAWVLIAAGLIVAWAWWRNRNTQQPGPTDTSGQVPQFVNQTFTGPEPPEPPPTPSRTKRHHRRDRDHDEDEDKRKRHREPQPQPQPSGPPYRKTLGPPTVSGTTEVVR